MAAPFVIQQDLGRAQHLQPREEDPMSHLAASVAHEIINYLAVIDGNASLLRTQMDDSAAQEGRIDEIVRATQRSLSLSEQLLALGRQPAVQREALSVSRVIADMERMLYHLVRDGIELTVECAPNTGLVWANPGQIEQVLLNLVANAQSAISGSGRITVQTANVDVDQASGDSSPSGRFVMIAVSDTGSGIDAETLPHIFEPFFTTKEDGLGTGLGLSTVYGIVHHSGGHIAVESEPGRGTTFRTCLPRMTDE